MQLKQFQLDSLKVLGEFFASARIHGAKTAFEDTVRNIEASGRRNRYRTTYKALRPNDPTPYVCLRLPTGGGKTILGAHAIKTAQGNWLETEAPVVLWFVTSDKIRQQTVEALKKAGHPYRQALDDAFGGAVRVFDADDFTTILPHDLRSNCTVIVATIQTFRVNDTNLRKVYAHNEMLEPHFTGVPADAPGLERIEATGRIKFSFANLMHLHSPLMVIDEAHNVVSGLSREVQARLNPSAIVELTATPADDANVLYAVTAQEVKDAKLIKLPIVLSEHQTWQQAVTGAIARRAELAAIAAKDREYIRPIVLFQAQDRNRDVTVDVLKQHLTDVENIDPRHIVVATGDQRGLDGVDLFDPNCPIEYVITVEALKEGWDCSFAYVFCSLANVASDRDAEQLLGRVLRMPYANERTDTALNRAYANLVSPQFMQAATQLKDALINKFGFEEAEASQTIEPGQAELAFGLFDQTPRLTGTTVPLKLSPVEAATVATAAGTKAVIDPQAGSIVIRQYFTPPEREALLEALPPAKREAVAKAIASFEDQNRHLQSPAEKGEAFVVPWLEAAIQGEFELADSEIMMENAEWRLSDHPARLSAFDFAPREEGQGWVVDLVGGHVKVEHAATTTQFQLDLPVEGWTEQSLVRWLDRQLHDPNIGQADLMAWLSDAVSHLTGARGIPLSSLKQCQYILARVLRDRIAAIKAKVRADAYQTSLFAPEAKPRLSVDTGFRFFDGIFGGEPRYAGSNKLTKHYTGWDNVPAFDGAPGGAEEKCAIALDSLDQVKFWLRNVAGHPAAFRLPTATGRFYPDFVARLTDGRTLVVEYKGSHIASNDEQKAKRAIGEKWGSLDRSRALFLWIEGTTTGADARQQLLDFLAANPA